MLPTHMNWPRISFSTFCLGSSLLLTSGCVETTNQGNTSPKVAEKNLSQDDVALRFLTAYIQGNRQSAVQYATAMAINKIPWGRSNTAYLPHYDDKKLLWFSGGWAKPLYQVIDGRIMIADFDVHRKY